MSKRQLEPPAPERVEVRHAAGDGADPGTARKAADRIGHVCASLLVTHVHQAQAGIAGCVQERIEAMAAERRDPFHSTLLKISDNQFRRGH